MQAKRSKPRLTVEEQLARYRDTSAGADACWGWTGARISTGYGAIRVAGAAVLAHRAAYAVAYGPIPDGAHVLHRCDNPPCTNPGHLFLGTHAENMRDMFAKGRRAAATGERVGSAKLTADAVRAIRDRYAAGGPTQAMLAHEFGVNDSVICRVISRKTWAHLP
jgi:hypothetical protein